MGGHVQPDESYVYEPWYKYGIYFLFFEAAIAIGVTIYSLSMTFSGQTVQFKKKVVHEQPKVQQAQQAQTPVEQQCLALEKHLQEECLKKAAASGK